MVNTPENDGYAGNWEGVAAKRGRRKKKAVLDWDRNLKENLL